MTSAVTWATTRPVLPVGGSKAVRLLRSTSLVAKLLDVERFRIRPHSRFRLSHLHPEVTSPFETREDAEKALAKSARRLYTLTELLYAQPRWSVLFVFQAMDGAGKDGAIKHVMRGLDPKSTHVVSFKSPTTEERKHDFLWRCGKALPERGSIGVFNRSYYEDVLVTRVHPELIEDQQPWARVSKRLWRERFEDICHWERYLSRNGTVIRKIFLNVSKAEQRRRFLERLQNPAKRWKLSANDLNERLKWNQYMLAYQDAIRATSTEEAPWYVVPADHKWFTRAVVAQIAIDTLQSLDLSIPALTHREKRAMAHARRRLRAR